jgi:hypothetical protein
MNNGINNYIEGQNITMGVHVLLIVLLNSN